MLLDLIFLLAFAQINLTSTLSTRNQEVTFVLHHDFFRSKSQFIRQRQTQIQSLVDGHDDIVQQHSPHNESSIYWKLPRLYLSSERLTETALVRLSPEQTHYLINVMRFFKKRKRDNDDVKPGNDCVRLFNGRDGEWLAKVRDPSQVEESNKRRRTRQRNELQLEAECLVKLRKQTDDESAPWVIFAPLKNQSRMKLMIEKCTELGVGAIILAKSDRTDGSVLSISTPSKDSKLDDVNGMRREPKDEEVLVGKLELQAIEASEQCERLSVPCITTDLSSILGESDTQGVVSISDIVKVWSSNCGSKNNELRKILVCRERGEQSFNVAPVLDILPDNKKVAFVIGPEGGWSLEEEDLFDNVCNEQSVRCVSLGSSVLRAETACMIAVGAWSLVHS